MENQRVAQIFQEIGDILELKGENRFRYLSYHRAAQTLLNLSKDIRKIYDNGELEGIPGIGKALAEKIAEILNTGKCGTHERLLAEFDKGLLELLTIRGLGPKKIKKFYDELGIDNIGKLKTAAEKGVLADLERMGEKSQADILKAIQEHEKHVARSHLITATFLAEFLIGYMKDCSKVSRAEYAGSLRRGRETVGDIDILATGKDHNQIIRHFLAHQDVSLVLAQGETKASVILEGGVQVDLRVVDEKSFGAALYYFTGSKNHNIATRKLAIKKGLKINEYGVFKGEKSIAGKTEKEIFKVLGLPYIIPELREDQGEVQAGFDGKLPKSVELADIRGDLHLHTNWSDGRNTLEEMVAAAQKLGYEYLCVSDHSTSARIANGLDLGRIKDQIKQVEALNKRLRGFKVFKGAEVDILTDGSLDFPDEILAQLDWITASVHSKFTLSSAEQTARLIKAISNPYVHVLGHPTGQIVNRREPYELDIAAVARAAAKNNVALEINSNMRLDLSATNIRIAKEHGVKFVINTDAHSIDQLGLMRFGVTTARRGWLEKGDVLNTLPIEALD
ncbi:DNA polymerase/3'-5' exonuclease PolX [Candidatus Peregrinibacteria bacterium]|jgi:DNA polymerase (family X)|nr:DNA polymerase/3'-5' exonuclease PolX [Candidatus Peregrinibacteria bacterium]MBT7703087.1 DNA polymerase/3'-5' exonuclease PolX [Candidatus Peregrinibacteria bacterium]